MCPEGTDSEVSLLFRDILVQELLLVLVIFLLASVMSKFLQLMLGCLQLTSSGKGRSHVDTTTPSEIGPKSYLVVWYRFLLILRVWDSVSDSQWNVVWDWEERCTRQRGFLLFATLDI